MKRKSIVNWNQVYPNPDSCHQFYKCANGTLTLETCGNGLLFNEVLLSGHVHVG